MKKITTLQIGDAIAAALENKKKNILFVSATVEYEPALEWFAQHPAYRLCRAKPQPYYAEKNGLLVKKEDFYILDNQTLEQANSEKTVWFINFFSEQCVNGFEGFLDIVKHRFYINKRPDGTCQKYPLEKMPLFLAFTSPTEGDYMRLDKKYYDLFDEVYQVV